MFFLITNPHDSNKNQLLAHFQIFLQIFQSGAQASLQEWLIFWARSTALKLKIFRDHSIITRIQWKLFFETQKVKNS